MASQIPEVQFFFDNAGWSYQPSIETPEDGRWRNARGLAAAERALNRLLMSGDVSISWEDDEWPDPDEYDAAPSELEGLESGKYVSVCCYLADRNGNVMASLHRITTNATDFPGYGQVDGFARVVQAELAEEACLAEFEQAYCKPFIVN